MAVADKLCKVSCGEGNVHEIETGQVEADRIQCRYAHWNHLPNSRKTSEIFTSHKCTLKLGELGPR